MTETTNKSKGKKLRGTVISTDMDKTAVVVIGRFVQHPKYLKYIKQESKQLVHDPEETATVGDTVLIEETRPISKKKRFVLKKVES